MKYSESSWKHWRNKAKTVRKMQVTTSGSKETMPLRQCHPHLISLLRNNVHSKSQSWFFTLITFIGFILIAYNKSF